MAHLFNNLLRPVGRLGIGLSRTLANLPLYMDREKSGISSVVSIGGTATPDLALTHHNPGLAVAQALDTDYYAICSPIIVASSTNRLTTLKDKFISRIFDMAAASDYALVGIGNVNDSQLMQMGYISEDELRDIQSQGVVGEIIGHYFTNEGKLVPTSIDHRIVAVDLPMACPIIGAAGDKNKVEPIVGAILSKYIQGLVTDKNTAESVIDILRKYCSKRAKQQTGGKR